MKIDPRLMEKVRSDPENAVVLLAEQIQILERQNNRLESRTESVQMRMWRVMDNIMNRQRRLDDKMEEIEQ